MKIKSLIKKYEWQLFITIFLILWGVLTYYTYYHQAGNSLGDTAFAAQILYNFKHGITMKSPFLISIVESINHFWYQPAEYVCSQPLNLESSTTPWVHFYLIMYIIAPFAKIMDIPLLIAVLQGGIYASVLAFTYRIARNSGLTIIISTLLAILVSQHPLWLAGLEGQFYFNRLFLSFSALIILLLSAKKINYYLLFFISLLAASTNEIYGIAIFIIFASYIWVKKQINVKVLILGFFFLLISFISLSYIQQDIGVKSTQTGYIDSVLGNGLSTIVNEVITSFSDQNTYIYLLVNIIFMGILALFNTNFLIPLVMVLAPNVIVDLGGAEKVGWSTHYHISYFIPLIWLSILGLKSLKISNKYKSLIIIIMLLISTYIGSLDLTLNDKPHIVLKSLFDKINYQRTHEKYQQIFINNIRQSVGNSSVSIPEAISFILYDRDIYYYPINIDKVDKVIFLYDDSREGNERFSSPNYGHQDTNLDDCILERMNKNGFNLDEPIIIDNWAIVSKK